MIFCSFLSASAQSGKYDEKVNVGNGLYKVKTHDRWGIVDDNDKLMLSVEYNEPLFMNGKAVITIFGTRQLAGVIDSVGNFTQYPPYFIDASYPFVCDDMLAVRKNASGNWGFLNTKTGELLKVEIDRIKNKNIKQLKKLGITGYGTKGTFIFEFVAPFVEGIAAVYTPKTGWHHIDSAGQERFSSTAPALFRSSLHNGECVIFGDKGIVVCKETPDYRAGVINYLENDYELKLYHEKLSYPYAIQTNNSRLTLNSKLQADKFENFSRGDSVILIERPKIVPPKIEVKKDSFNMARDIRVELSKNAVSASSKGTAPVTISITNTGEFESAPLEIVITIKGTKKEWQGIIAAGETQEVTLHIPAKFSASSITRAVSWVLKDHNDELSGEETITIRRYRPSRR